jgi:hypothetical protein
MCEPFYGSGRIVSTDEGKTWVRTQPADHAAVFISWDKVEDDDVTRDFLRPTPERMIAVCEHPMQYGDGVTTRQTFAISNPLLDPTDMDALQKFADKILRDGAGFFTILTVDHYCDGITCWHVSVTALSLKFKTDCMERPKAVTTGIGPQDCTGIA